MRFCYFLVVLLGLSLSAVSFCLTEPPANSEDGFRSVTQLDNGNSDKLRTGFKIPEFFNFARFKQMFDKHYSSFIEEIVRKKIFLGRCFASFISMFKYRHGQVSHFLCINQMSDETPEERRMRYPDPEKMHISDLDATRLASKEDIARELASIDDHESKRGFGKFDEISVNSIDKGDEQVLRNRRSARPPTQLDELHATTSERESSGVEDKNLQQDSLELDSSTRGQQRKPRIDLSSVLSNFKEVPIVGTAINTVHNMYADKPVMSRESEVVPDMMYIDHRVKKCHFLPRDQGRCGCCYAFALIALFEYVFCTETGVLVPFSEQYVVDCGYREALDGCASGRIDFGLKFVENYGLEFRADYPYMEKNGTCPYETDTTLDQMGTIKMDTFKGGIYEIKYVNFMLSLRPVAIGLRTSPDFPDYGGGVHDPVDCNAGAHAMLIVGYGREDGNDFYLIRNSHSVTWGESGYYKLNAESLYRCALDPYIFTTHSIFVEADKNMNKHNLAKIKAYHNNLLLNQEIF